MLQLGIALPSSEGPISMPTNATAQNLDATPLTISSRQLDTRWPLAIITASFSLLGVAALCRMILPNHADWAMLLAILIFCAWLIAMSKAGHFPLTLNPWRRRTGFSFPQALADGLAVFVFLMVASSYVEFHLSLLRVGCYAVVGLALGLFNSWYAVPKPSS
jgi:hypothetical protein